MIFSEIFPGFAAFKNTPENPKPSLKKILIAQRPPNNSDPINHFFWYDRSTKTMYRATEKGYVED